MPDLGCDHRLRAGRQRRVANGQRLVVGEVARLLLVGERVAAPVQREHEVGLLDDLLAVEVEVREVQEQRVLVAAPCARSPSTWCSVKPSDCGWTPRSSSHGTTMSSAASRQVAASSKSAPSSAARRGMARDGVGGGAQVPLREQVRVDVVVGDRAVLVRPGDAVDAEAALRIVMAERAPQARRLDEQLEADLALEGVVVRSRRGSARRRRRCRRRCGTRPCPRASSRSTPGRGSSATGTRRPSSPSWRARSRARSSVAWRQRSASAAASRRRVREHRQDEALRVPERVAVVAGPGQALGGDRALLGAGPGLERVEEREAHGLLELGVALELDVGAVPEVVEVRALAGEQAVPARVSRLGERGDHLVADGRERALARPAVGEELDDPQALALARGRPRRSRGRRRAALRERLGAVGALDDVVHRRRPCGACCACVEWTSTTRRPWSKNSSERSGDSSTAAARGSG